MEVMISQDIFFLYRKIKAVIKKGHLTSLFVCSVVPFLPTTHHSRNGWQLEETRIHDSDTKTRNLPLYFEL